MSEENVHQFKTGKRKTSHEKGVAPEKALKKRRGPVEVKYIDDYHKRKQTQSNRLTGLWRKAKEVAVMTGVALKLQVRDEHYDSVEAGHAKEGHYKKTVKKSANKPAATVTFLDQPTPSSNQETPSTDQETASADKQTPSTSVSILDDVLDDPALSPRAIRQETAPTVAIQIPKETEVPQSKVKDTMETGVQCNILVGIPYSGIEKQCRMCGAVYENDSRTRKGLWLGCETRACKYWVHADCLLGKSPKLTPDFIKAIPFKCPKHK